MEQYEEEKEQEIAKHRVLRVRMENAPRVLLVLYFTNVFFPTSILLPIFKLKCSDSSLWMILGYGIATSAFASSAWVLGDFAGMLNRQK